MTVLRTFYLGDPVTNVKASVRPLKAGDTSGALNIHDLDNHRTIVQENFCNYTGTDAVPNADIVQDDKVINFAAHPFIVDDFVKVFNGVTWCIGVFKITATTATTITLNRPTDHAYIAAGTMVEKVIIDLGTVNGSVTPVVFEARIKPNKIIHAEEVVITSVSGGSGVPDGSKFINQPALTNGIILRQYLASEGKKKTLLQWVSNKDLFLYCRNSVTYTSGTLEGVNALWSPKASADVVLNLEQPPGDQLVVIVQDNLSALVSVSLEMLASWHYTDE